MTDRQIHLLSPYRLPTSYPLQLSADEPAAWLNGYAALWHPAALAGAAQPPQASNSYDHDSPRATLQRLRVLARLGDPRPAAPRRRVARVARGRAAGHAAGLRRDARTPRGGRPGAVRGTEGEGPPRPAGERGPVLRGVPRA